MFLFFLGGLGAFFVFHFECGAWICDNSTVLDIRNQFNDILKEMRGLHYPKYTLLMEVLEREFDREVPEAKRTAFAEKLLPLIDKVFSIYDLTDDFFAQSPEYDLLYSELTGAVILYLEEYGI